MLPVDGMELNERYIKLSSARPIVTDLLLSVGQDIDVTVTVDRAEVENNHDGTYNLVYKCYLLNVPTQREGQPED